MDELNKLTCKACGKLFERTGKRGRPRTECYSCTPAGVFPTRKRRLAAAACDGCKHSLALCVCVAVDEPQGCRHCGNVDRMCACTGNVINVAAY